MPTQSVSVKPNIIPLSCGRGRAFSAGEGADFTGEAAGRNAAGR